MKIMVLSTGLGYYFAATCSTDTLTYLWKYLFSSTTTASCQKITTMDVIAYGQLRINDNQLFLIGNEPLSTYHLQYYKITFGNTAVDWANKISWASGSWSVSNSESLLSSDNSLIYTFATFGSTQYLYFITFSTSTGSVVGSRYKSSSTWTGAWKAVLTGDFIWLSITCTNDSLLIFNIVTSQFIIKQFTGAAFSGFGLEPINGRYEY